MYLCVSDTGSFCARVHVRGTCGAHGLWYYFVVAAKYDTSRHAGAVAATAAAGGRGPAFRAESTPAAPLISAAAEALSGASALGDAYDGDATNPEVAGRFVEAMPRVRCARRRRRPGRVIRAAACARERYACARGCDDSGVVALPAQRAVSRFALPRVLLLLRSSDVSRV